jgi:hypothetical protein
MSKAVFQPIFEQTRNQINLYYSSAVIDPIFFSFMDRFAISDHLQHNPFERKIRKYRTEKLINNLTLKKIKLR